MYKIIYFVPVDAKERTKDALFSVGAGSFEKYMKCSWEVLGTGQFMPVKDANPSIGSIDTLERVEEYRVEMICKGELIEEAIKILKETHPYEEVAYEVIKLEEF
ncbi:MAG: NGG1p interacting factor NIF3 [Campylobacterales bacterium]|nr:NGG1p interacting factor NIF3 [Campylobacterales bacterium]